MSQNTATSYSQIPDTSRLEGAPGAPKNVLTAFVRFVDSLDRACRASAEYEKRISTANQSQWGQIARTVYDEFSADR